MALRCILIWRSFIPFSQTLNYSTLSVRRLLRENGREDFHDSIVLAMNQKVTDGTSSIYSRPCYGYRKAEDGSLAIIPEEAKMCG